MSDGDTRYTNWAGFGSNPDTGIAINMALVPNTETTETRGSHLRSTGEGYTLADGTRVARVEGVAGPIDGSADDSTDLSDYPDGDPDD